MLEIIDHSKIHISFIICMLISFFLKVNSTELSNLKYPSTYVLLSQDIILVTSEGIRFFSSKMELYESKYITLDKGIENLDQYGRTTISQFDADNGGYLMVLANEIMYFFKHDGTLINKVDLSGSINSTYYTLIPYKNEDNYLHYIISYPLTTLSFGFTYYKFNINSPNTNLIVKEKTITPSIQSQSSSINFLSGSRCLFMTHPVLNREILVCFYAIRLPMEVQTRSFDPSNDFNEIDSYLKYCVPMGFEYYLSPVNFDIVPNKNKDTVNIFFGFQNGYRLTFDFTNFFGTGTATSFTNHYIREFT